LRVASLADNFKRKWDIVVDKIKLYASAADRRYCRFLLPERQRHVVIRVISILARIVLAVVMVWFTRKVNSLYIL
jgi:hypothetical protein